MKILRFWFPVICYSGIIFYVSGIPKLDAPGTFPHGDKIFHFLEYLPYGYLVAVAFGGTWPQLSGRSVFQLAFLFCLAYAASDEIHQLFVEGRSFSIADWMADGLGSALGNYIYTFKIRKG